jgi:beta-glucosidase
MKLRRSATLFILSAFALSLLTACLQPQPRYKNPATEIQDRVIDLLSRMTIEEKIGQMTQVARDYIKSPADIAAYGFGSILSGGGSSPQANTPAAWADMIDSYQRLALASRLGIPILYGVDAVHGNNNVRGSVIFPHNIGLGAARSSELVRGAARVTALEMLATGARWNFAPCIAVPQDVRWGRTYEGFGQDPSLVSELGAAAIAGYQEGGLGAPGTMLATPKHFAADGGTLGGIDRGDARISQEALRSIHLAPYQAAVAAGAASVMVSFSSINGVKSHGNRDLVTRTLRGTLGFTGFVVSDWGGAKELPGTPREQIKAAVNAGIDMLMIPDAYPEFRAVMLDLVKTGEVSQARVEEAARNILTVKFLTGVFEHPFADRSLLPSVGSAEHRRVAREAVRASLVLLKNDGAVLPFGGKVKRILVTGAASDDLGRQCGGWTVTWQGGPGPITEGTTILQGIRDAAGSGVTVISSLDGTLPAGEKAPDITVLVVGEDPYAEMKGDRLDLILYQRDKDALAAARAIGAADRDGPGVGTAPRRHRGARHGGCLRRGLAARNGGGRGRRRSVRKSGFHGQASARLAQGPDQHTHGRRRAPRKPHGRQLGGVGAERDTARHAAFPLWGGAHGVKVRD